MYAYIRFLLIIYLGVRYFFAIYKIMTLFARCVDCYSLLTMQ